MSFLQCLLRSAPNPMKMLKSQKKTQSLTNPSTQNSKNPLKLIFFYNVMASGGLYSFYLHQQFTVLIIIFVHWTQLLEYWTHNGITCYELYYCYCPCRDFLSILLSWTCHVFKLYPSRFVALTVQSGFYSVKLPASDCWASDCQTFFSVI